MKQQSQTPELLLPAGSLDKLKIAFDYGADAVYMGLPIGSLRARNNTINKESFLEGLAYARKLNKKVYTTINIYPHNKKINAMEDYIKWLASEAKPDALIVADPGVIDLIQELYPEAEIHLSVQANNVNWRQLKFWQKQGVTRTILSRELRLNEIKEIHESVPTMELEFFIHGAICIAYSGRCLISNYMAARDPNYGTCSHSCRWKYDMHESLDLGSGDSSETEQEISHNPHPNMVYIEEEKRKGEMYPMEEDEHGNYLMNSKDLCLMPYLKELYEAGVCSFKVEGRSKTEYYCGTVTKYYRQAIDDMMNGKQFNPELLEKLRRTPHRPEIPGFLFGNPTQAGVYYESTAPICDWQYVARILENLGEGLYTIEAKNKCTVGTELEIVTPSIDCIDKVEFFENYDTSERVDTIHGGTGKWIIKLNNATYPVNSFLRQKIDPSLNKASTHNFEDEILNAKSL